MERLRWAIAVHGGAGTIPQGDPHEEHIQGLKAAVQTGAHLLQEVSSPQCANYNSLSSLPLAVTAAVAAVQCLEDNPLFNAGRGSVLNTKKTIEMEAAVINGVDQQAGAVTGLTTVKNPIMLASLVLKDSKFQFLGFEHAENFASTYGSVVERRPNSYFVTERRLKSLERVLKKKQAPPGDIIESNSRNSTGKMAQEPETVGAVVMDPSGNLACATSTGGLTAKVPGRIGDTPLVGAGSYAQNGLCALSGTGIGEEFIRHSSAVRVACAMEYGEFGLEEAMWKVVFERMAKGSGGFIGVDAHGGIVQEFNGEGLYRASMDSSGRRKVGIWKEENDF